MISSCCSVIAETCPDLTDLLVAQTWITDNGLRALAYTRPPEEQMRPHLRRLRILDVSDTKVLVKQSFVPQRMKPAFSLQTSAAGLAEFLLTHSRVASIEHPETFKIFETLGDEK